MYAADFNARRWLAVAISEDYFHWLCSRLQTHKALANIREIVEVLPAVPMSSFLTQAQFQKVKFKYPPWTADLGCRMGNSCTTCCRINPPFWRVWPSMKMVCWLVVEIMALSGASLTFALFFNAECAMPILSLAVNNQSKNLPPASFSAMDA